MSNRAKINGIIGGAVFVIALVLFFVCCRRVVVDAGHEAVLVKKPYFFGHGGVDKEPIRTGSVWVARSTEAWQYPITPVQYTEKFDDMNTKNKSLVDFNSYVKITITNIPLLQEKFGPKWYENNIKEVYRTIIRNESRAQTQDDLMSNPAIVKSMEDRVQKLLAEHVANIAIPLKIHDVVIGKVTPNKEVLDEINRTAAQQQRKNTEDQRKLAEDARKQAESSRAAADNAYRQSMSLSPEQFIQNEAIKAFVKSSELCSTGKDCTMVLVPPGQNFTLPKK